MVSGHFKITAFEWSQKWVSYTSLTVKISQSLCKTIRTNKLNQVLLNNSWLQKLDRKCFWKIHRLLSNLITYNILALTLHLPTKGWLFQFWFSKKKKEKYFRIMPPLISPEKTPDKWALYIPWDENRYCWFISFTIHVEVNFQIITLHIKQTWDRLKIDFYKGKKVIAKRLF